MTREAGPVLLALALLAPAAAFLPATLATDPLGPPEDATVVAMDTHVVHRDLGPSGESTAGPQAADLDDGGAEEGCTRYETRRFVDAGVLWFNDQFVFGELEHALVSEDDCEEGEQPDELVQREEHLRDPYATVVGTARTCDGCAPAEGFVLAYDARLSEDRARTLVEADRACRGCVFDYNSSYILTDPNDATWIVDELFAATAVSPPQPCKLPTTTPCQDGDPHPGPVRQPLYVVRQQTDPASPEADARVDEAVFECPDGTLRDGAPSGSQPCHEADPLRYAYLAVADMEAFTANAWEPQHRQHGTGADAGQPSLTGNAHPANPAIPGPDPGPQHTHDGLHLRLSFSVAAPWFVEANPHWDEHGQPPALTAGCGPAGPADDRAGAIEAREPAVCDLEAREPFHVHDGSQTVP